MKALSRLLMLSLFTLAPAVSAHANEIADWNRIMLQAAADVATSPLNMTRVAAIVHASVFDAVNGIDRRFTPIRVTDEAPRGASVRAAAVQAAYASLKRLYPGAAQQAMFDAARTASLAGLASEAASENSQSIARGIAWGQLVADAIWAWRSGDGFSVTGPAFDPGPAVAGRWQRTPPGTGATAGYPQFSGLAPQFPGQTTWVLTSAALANVIPAAPPALNSQQYVDDHNEVYALTNFAKTPAGAEEKSFSIFWNVGTASAYWDRAALQLADQFHLTFSETARLIALVNLSMADAAIGCWVTKYKYAFWRPIQAIRFDDGNPATIQDNAWTTLAEIPTPAHPDYPSGHSCVSGAAGQVLATYFGDQTPFSLTSNTAMNDPASARFWPSFTDALEEVKNARIYSGIHFRTACNVGQTLGIAVADYVGANALLPLHGNKTGQLSKE